MVNQENREPKVLDPEADEAVDATAGAESGGESPIVAAAPDLLAVEVHQDEHHNIMPGFAEPAERADVAGKTPVLSSLRRGGKDVRDFILGEIGGRSVRAGRKLRTQLNGVIQLEIFDLQQRYVFDWQESDLKIQEGTADQVDCQISLSSADLLSISSGELNAQIAMLSDKVRVAGKAGMAVYFFNLFAV